MSDFFEPDTVYVNGENLYRAPEITPEFWCVGILVHPTNPDNKIAFGWGRNGHGQEWQATPFAFQPQHFEAWGHVSPYADPKRVVKG